MKRWRSFSGRCGGEAPGKPEAPNQLLQGRPPQRLQSRAGVVPHSHAKSGSIAAPQCAPFCSTLLHTAQVCFGQLLPRKEARWNVEIPGEGPGWAVPRVETRVLRPSETHFPSFVLQLDERAHPGTESVSPHSFSRSSALRAVPLEQLERDPTPPAPAKISPRPKL